jgi:hypothetical protein
MEIPLDYETLRVIWWGLMGTLLIGFALTDGYDLGVASLMPFIGKTDEERRMAINAIAPHWEGHQVWFILGGGAIFAAWPFVYAVSFSGFYLAMFLVLSALILRPVAFKYRSKRPDPAWRSRWDWALFTGGFVPALVFGVAVGNVLQGAPFRLDSDLRSFYEGSLIGLFSPFAMMTGLLSVAMVVMHGAGFLSVKIERWAVLARARRIGSVAAVASRDPVRGRRPVGCQWGDGFPRGRRGRQRPLEPAVRKNGGGAWCLDGQLWPPSVDADRPDPRPGWTCYRAARHPARSHALAWPDRRWQRWALSPRWACQCSPSSCPARSIRNRA